MLLENIKLKNFGPFVDKEVEFNSNLIALSGLNGKGKTFILEACFACLYGEWPTRGKLSAGLPPDTIGISEIECQIGDIHIKRRLTRKSPSSISQDVFLNGDKIHVPELNEYIENMFGPKRTFLASSFSAQNDKGDICDANPTERKEILYDFLDLNQYEDAHEFFKEKCKSSSERICSLKSGIGARESLLTPIREYHDKDQCIASKEAKLFMLQDTRGKLEALDLNIEEASKATGKLQAFIKHAEEDRNRLEKEQSQIHEELAYLEERFKTAHDFDITKKNEEVEAKNQALGEAKIEANTHLSCYAKTREKYDEMLKQAGLLKKDCFDNEKCKTCALLKSARSARDAMKGIDLPSDSKVQMWKDLIKEPNKRLIKGESKESIQGKVNILRQRFQEISIEINSLHNESTTEKGFSQPGDQLNSLKIEKSSLERTVDNLTNGVVKDSHLIDVFQKNNSLKADINLSRSDLKKLESDLSGYEFLKHAHSKKGIPALLIDQALPAIQIIIDDLLESVSEGRLSVTFTTLKELKSGEKRESLDILCNSQSGTRDISTFSGGEQRLFRTVVRLALAIFQSQSSNKKGRILFLDEAFDALDGEASIRLIELLKSLDKYFDQIIFISHNDMLLGDIEEIIRL